MKRSELRKETALCKNKFIIIIIQARAAIVLSDLGCTDDNQNALVAQGALSALVSALESELEDVLVNAVNAIRVLCMNHRGNQLEVARCGAVEPLVEFLSINSGKSRSLSYFTGFITELSYSKNGGVHTRLHIYPLCRIFYLTRHRHQTEGTNGFSVSSWQSGVNGIAKAQV